MGSSGSPGSISTGRICRIRSQAVITSKDVIRSKCNRIGWYPLNCICMYADVTLKYLVHVATSFNLK